ncbi:MAG: hypothetical protein BGO69_11440 [Bacteroidetes bacterium 46-16]|nr:MAG: hypothetical protein BGO69_11440 [Bacteroidetes bacterium 46-16]
MIQKQLVQATKEILHFLFYWDEYIINQLFLSALLILLFGRTFILAGLEIVKKAYRFILEALFQKEHYDSEHVFALQTNTGDRQ